MHLTRGNITAASRIMLPVYPVLCACIGLSYLLGAPSRTASPAFDAAKALMPMRSWGAVFLAFAIMLVFGYLMRSRDVTAFVLYMGAAAFTLWAICFALSVVTTPDASLVAPAWPGFAAAACTASAISVTRNEGATDGRQ